MTSSPSLNRRTLLTGAAALAAMPAAGTLLTGTASAATPMQGLKRGHVYRAKLGKFEITTILDGTMLVEGPHNLFGKNQTEDAVKALAQENFLPSDKIELPFAPVLINTGEKLVLFDAGNGVGRRPNAGKLASLLGEAGLSPDQIDIVVITHCHPDHIGGLMEEGKPLFPKAAYMIGQAEYDFWSKKDRLSGPTENVAKLVQSNVVPLAEKMSFLKPEDEVVPGIRAVNAFGHTPGLLAFHIESEGKRLVIMSDVTNHHVLSLMRPDWHFGFDMDTEAAAKTRKRILDMLATDRIPMSGYHMPFPSIGFVEKTGEGYRWVQASYQLHL